jgi:hypothetical protein
VFQLYGNEQLGMAEQHLYLSKEEVATVLQREVKAGKDLGLRLRVEVHQGVPTGKQVDAGNRRILHQVVTAKDNRAAQVLAEGKQGAVVGLQVPRDVILWHSFE